MNWSQIMTIPEHGSDEFIEILKDRKIAGIVQSNSRCAVGRQIAAFAGNIGLNYHPFTSEQEAIDWLETP